MCAVKADQGGRASLLTAQSRLKALSLVHAGRVFDLDHEISTGAPHYPRVQPPYLMSLWTSAERVIRNLRRQGVKNDPGVNLEHVHMTFHVGTHVDALGHFSIDDAMYGGRSVQNIVGDQGLRELGIEHVPSLITRGICIDVANRDGGDYLEVGRALGPDDLQAELVRRGLRIKAGDVVLIRTGWSRFYKSDKERYVSGEPGINIEAARWLTSQGVCAIGADTMAVEVLPGANADISMPVHQHCLVEKGVYLIENLFLDELTSAGQWEFCFIMLPARFRGATGAPVRPVALT